MCVYFVDSSSKISIFSGFSIFISYFNYFYFDQENYKTEIYHIFANKCKNKVSNVSLKNLL